MNEGMEKNDMLKAIVLLLLGFVIGFATHAFIGVSGDTGTDGEQSKVTDDGQGTKPKVVIPSTELKEKGEKPKIVIPPTNTGSEEKAPADSVSIDVTPNNVEGGSYQLSIENQAAGDTVNVARMQLEQNAWVAIREEGADHGMGNVLGAGWFPAGVHSGTVTLLRGTEPKRTYYGVIYVDNGDKKFSLKDEKLVEVNGEPFAVKFLTY